MVSRLCVTLGKHCDSHGGDTSFSFPTCQAIASASMNKLNRIGLGYRTEYIKTFACDVDSGKYDLKRLTDTTESNKLRDMILEIKGVGPYAAHHIMMLLGNYEFIPCDSEVATYLGLPGQTRWHEVETAAVQKYGHWGRFLFLAYKLERVFSNTNYIDC